MLKRSCFLHGLILVALLAVGCQKPQKPIIPEILAEVPFDPGHPLDMAGNAQTGQMYILNGDRVIGVFKGDEQIATIQTDERKTRALAIDEERGWTYVVNDHTDTVTIIRDMEVVAVLETSGDEPQDIALEPTSGWAYVVSPFEKNPREGQERIIQGSLTIVTGVEVIGVIQLGRVLATNVVADPINGLVYVGGVGGEIIVIREMEEVARLTVGSTVQAMDVNPNTGDIFVLNALGPEYLHHFRNGEFVDALDVERDGGSVTNMKVHPTTGDVYVVDRIAREVVVVRSIDDKLQVIGRAPVGSGPEKMAIDPITGNVYVANFYDDTISVIQGTETIATIDVGWYPYGIGVNPANGWVYVSNTNDNTVTVLGFEE